MLKDKVSLGVANETCIFQYRYIRILSRDVLLLSRASPLPLRKQYGPTGSSKPVITPNVASRPRSQLSVAAAVDDTLTPLTVLSSLRNIGTPIIEFSMGSSCWFRPAGTRNRKSFSGPVSPDAAKAPSANTQAKEHDLGAKEEPGFARNIGDIEGVPKDRQHATTDGRLQIPARRTHPSDQGNLWYS